MVVERGVVVWLLVGGRTAQARGLDATGEEGDFSLSLSRAQWPLML